MERLHSASDAEEAVAVLKTQLRLDDGLCVAGIVLLTSEVRPTNCACFDQAS
jgi:hypothetical protein